MTLPEPPKHGEQLFEQVIFITEKNFAKRLGNSDRVERWQTVRFFKAARREWLDAWKRFARKQGVGSVLNLHRKAHRPKKAQTIKIGDSRPQRYRNQAFFIEAKNEGTQPFNPRFSRTSFRNFRRRKETPMRFPNRNFPEPVAAAAAQTTYYKCLGSPREWPPQATKNKG